MLTVDVKTLVVVKPPQPSFIILKPQEDLPGHEGKVIPIWIGYAEALSLGAALENKRFERPMTHDLMLDAITNLDGLVDHVVITRVEGPRFYSQVTLRQYGRLVSLDARPSDALSLAVRQSTPVYLEEDVLRSVGCTFSFTDQKGTVEKVKEMDDFKKFVADVSPEDFAE